MRSETHPRLGEISTAADGSVTLRFERHVAHSPERVWAALTESAQLAQWFMPGTLEPRHGGRLRLDSGEEGGTLGDVLVWDPPRLLAYSWGRHGGAGPRSVVHWELHPNDAGDSTLLVLEHRGVERDAAYDYGAGWHDFLDRLPRHLDGEDTKDWAGAYDELLVQYRDLALTASDDRAAATAVRHRYEIYIGADPATVWQALTDASLTKRYFMGLSVESTWEVGAAVRQVRRDGLIWNEGVVVEFDPPRKLVTTFRSMAPEALSDPPTRVTWLLEHAGEITRLVLTHDGFEAETTTFAIVESGWSSVLSSLKTFLETGEILQVPAQPGFDNR